MSKHTPGPWTAKNDGGSWIILDGRNNCIAVPGIEPEVNGRLIAAAPRMLDALYKAQRALVERGYKGFALQEIEGAIAEATGDA